MPDCGWQGGTLAGPRVAPTVSCRRVSGPGSGDALRKMRRAVGRPLRAVLGQLGYDVVRASAGSYVPPDCDAFTAELIERVAPYTLTTPERIIGLVDAVRYLISADVPGAFAECGVWRGGSVMVMARTLVDAGVTDRELYLYDTFHQNLSPGEHDMTLAGAPVADAFNQARGHPALQHLPMEELRAALLGTGYPEARFHLVAGLVEETLPANAPATLALCRLDTDLYESTAHELEHLWPRISPGGVLLIDDYGHFMGAKKAVDEYFERIGTPVLLERLDSSARLVLKAR
jgi:hypothetical protein